MFFLCQPFCGLCTAGAHQPYIIPWVYVDLPPQPGDTPGQLSIGPIPLSCGSRLHAGVTPIYIYRYPPPPPSFKNTNNALVRTTAGAVSVQFWDFSVVLAKGGGVTGGNSVLEGVLLHEVQGQQQVLVHLCTSCCLLHIPPPFCPHRRTSAAATPPATDRHTLCLRPFPPARLAAWPSGGTRSPYKTGASVSFQRDKRAGSALKRFCTASTSAAETRWPQTRRSSGCRALAQRCRRGWLLRLFSWSTRPDWRLFWTKGTCHLPLPVPCYMRQGVRQGA